MAVAEPPFGCVGECCGGCLSTDLVHAAAKGALLCVGDLAATVVHHPLWMLRVLTAPASVAGLAAAMIRRYQTGISAHRPARCPFTPSCSNYGLAAFETHGFRRGLALTAGRLWRCRAGVAWGTPDPVTAA
ncbi:membrane protein insertion efficiency factor YidD [Dactylosporangium siamense]|uniref:Membrane protein insertion efficiency factor n=1 Tax=Dactylosporangium siamense TaxID=685454 RepID=A0A919PFV6_9ACTN|nr:membrane protein insertion efficiency factor YidD [Dactylosporangium siamense]GIG43417.1 hypothetical protein Dsi01nite_014580 [Dactylosporangium siamense]